MKKVYSFSSVIALTITRYFKLKTALGRRYSVEYKIFKHLDSFLSTNKCNLTTESFPEWCRTYQHLTSGVRRNWMRIVRNLCLYRRRTEPLCFVPDFLQFPMPHQTIQPHIFTKDEIIRLLNAIKKLKAGAESPMRQENFKLALVLLYTSGLRRGELLKLTIGDYNKKEHTLLIRESKFHKSRVIPLSQDGWKEIESHLKKRRRRRLPSTAESPLMWNCNSNNQRMNGSYSGPGVRSTFCNLFRIANIITESGNLPRLHDLRHTFAVHALLRWYDEGLDVQAKLPSLSIYMGHASIVSTQYYLRFIDAVVNTASKRFTKRYSSLVTKHNNRGDK